MATFRFRPSQSNGGHQSNGWRRSNGGRRSNDRRQSNDRRRQPRTPFCSVCKKAGKSEAEYTSHFVRDRPGPDGRVVCPTLLATECRYCRETGHTKHHCPKLAEKARRQKERDRITKFRRAENRLRKQVEEPHIVVKMGGRCMRVPIKGNKTAAIITKIAVPTNSRFDALSYDSDDESCCKQQQVGPLICEPAAVTGVWGAGASAVQNAASTCQDDKPMRWHKPKPVSPKPAPRKMRSVSFAHDSENVMKPLPSEVHEFHRDDSPIMISSPRSEKMVSEDAAYLLTHGNLTSVELKSLPAGRT